MYRKKPNPNGAGGPCKLTPEMIKQTYKLALLGSTEKQIADFFEISTGTIDYWKQQKPQFKEALRKGRLIADANISHALYQVGMGYSHPDNVILTNRITEYDDDGKPLRSYTEPLVVPTIKHYPPNPYAINKWLSCRQRGTWADVTKLEVSGQISMLHFENLPDMTELTNEEIKLAMKLGIQKALKEAPVESN